MPSLSIYRSMDVIVDDNLLFKSMAIVHNVGHWEFFKFSSRCCECRPLNFAKGHRSQQLSHPDSIGVIYVTILPPDFLFHNLSLNSTCSNHLET